MDMFVEDDFPSLYGYSSQYKHVSDFELLLS
jgi:hypothetical protein